jgi:assimilatory nitrate reductase catalytic subunit
VARRMGFAEAFGYRSAADVFREHAALSAFENDGARDFDLGLLAEMTDDAYDTLEPVQWPLRTGEPPRDIRFFADGGFFTQDRKARFVAPEPPALREATSDAFPFRLNTGRIRDQWHTMTRTGLSARLAVHLPEPFVEVHPQDADAAGLTDGGIAQISTPHGACVVKVVVSDGQRPGSLFVPIHWSGETASCARVGDLVSPHTDPYSGQPEAKATPAAIAPIMLPLRGFTRTRRAVALPEGTWWARVAVAEGAEYRLATVHGPMVWHDFAYRVLAGDAKLAEQLDGNIYRAAAFIDGELDGCLCVGPADASPQWDAAALCLDGADHGRPTARVSNDHIGATAPVVCACFGVAIEAVRKAVACGTARNVADIGRTLRAGTNCGSCLPELKRIIVHERIAHPS